MPPQKKIQHLRSKNKLLLDKIESHSSQIEADLKYLKRTIRGTADKSPSCNDARYKNWTKRNNSLQVTEALSSCTKCLNDGVPKKSTFSSRAKSRESTNAKYEDKNVDRIENLKSDPVLYSPDKKKGTVRGRLSLINSGKCGVDDPRQNLKSISEIVSLIDYSPKSTFVKRMKSKCKPYNRECYVKSSKEKEEPVSNFHVEKQGKKKKTKEDPQMLYRDSLCTVCRKRIKRCPTICTCEDESSQSEELNKCERVSEKSEELERLKDFRERNWQDCHADPSNSDSFHCCGHHKCNQVYGINDRLFAVPLDYCENRAHCPSCHHLKCQQSCCANTKQVIVTIPTSLLESNTLDNDKVKKLKGAKENVSVSKELLKKLQRPVPHNSMALRYQKGVC